MEFRDRLRGAWLAVQVFGLSLTAAAVANSWWEARPARSPTDCCRHAVPSAGVPQMVISRIPLRLGEETSCQQALNSVTAGVGWFAVNSVSGAFALKRLAALAESALASTLVGRGADRHWRFFSATTWWQTFETRTVFPLLGVCPSCSPPSSRSARPHASGGSGGHRKLFCWLSRRFVWLRRGPGNSVRPRTTPRYPPSRTASPVADRPLRRLRSVRFLRRAPSSSAPLRATIGQADNHQPEQKAFTGQPAVRASPTSPCSPSR